VELKVDKREKLAREIAKIVGVTALALSLVATVTFANSASNSFSSELSALDDLLDSDAYNTNSWDDSWVPTGFTAWSEDSNIAFQWSTSTASYDCSDCIYWLVDVISKNGCPSGVYASLNIQKGGVTLDWTNDSVPYLGPMEKARLAFEKYGYGTSGSNYQGDLTTLNCR